MLTEAMQGAGIVIGTVGLCGLGWWLMQSDAREPMHLAGGFDLPTVAIQPDGSVYVKPDRERLGGATKAPRLRGGVR